MASYPTSFGGHRYRLNPAALERDAAFDACNADGGYLAVVDDANEQAFLAGLVNAQPGDAWIGFDDLLVEGTFVWVNHSTTSYTNWASGEPSDGGSAKDEDCAYMTDNNAGHMNQWNDTKCSDTRESLCECDPDYVAPKTPACRSAAGFVDVLGRRYQTHSFSSWTAADATCRSSGAYLFSQADLTENALLFASTNSGGLGLVNDAWIGLAANAGGNAFVWSDGANSKFTDWNGNAPAPDVGVCVDARAANGKWETNPCVNSEVFACECDPQYPTQ